LCNHTGTNMPAGRKPRGRTIKRFTKRTSLKTRRTNRRNTRLGNRPRRSINRAPSGYAFTREIIDRDFNSIDLYDLTWAASSHKWGVLRLGAAFDEMVNPGEFSSLFQQYLIRSLTFNITSFFDSQLPGFEAIAAPTAVPPLAPRYTMPMAPKVEMIVVPNDCFLAMEADYANLSDVQIMNRLAQLQRKRISTLSYTKKFHVSQPCTRKQVQMNIVPQVAGVPAQVVTTKQINAKATWWPLSATGTEIRHYGVTILFRRVDGQPFQNPAFWSSNPPDGPGIEEPYVPTPKLRVQKHVNFSCRAVQ